MIIQEKKLINEKQEKENENENVVDILNNKINSIINISELFLNLLNNNELSNLTSKKINEIKEKIETKEKEINEDKLFLEIITKNKKK